MKHLALHLPLLLTSLLIPSAILVLNFDDADEMRAIRNLNPEQAQLAMERIFEPPQRARVQVPDLLSPFQRAMDAQPAIYVALLFTIFEEEFRDRAFAGQGEGQGNGLCVLLKNQHMLPSRLSYFAPRPGTSMARMPFPVLREAWVAFSQTPNRGLPEEAADLALPDAPAPGLMLPVLDLLRPLLHTMMDAQGQVEYQALTDRFLNIYAAHYLEGNPREWAVLFRNKRNRFSLARSAHLRALLWMLVGRPFQEVMAAHPALFQPDAEPEWLIPGNPVPAALFGDPAEEDVQGERRGRRRRAFQPIAVPQPPQPPPPPPPPPFPPPALLLPWGPVEPLQLPVQPAVQLLDNPDGTLRVVAAPVAAQPPPPPPVNPVRAAPPSSGSCQAGPSGTVSTGAGRTSQATCSAAARPVAAPIVAAAPVAVEAPPEPPAAPPEPPAPPAAPPAAVPVAPPANAPEAPEAPVPDEGGNRRAAGAGFHALNSEDINAIFALTKMRQRKLEQEARKQEDGPPPAKKHKPDEPPKGGGGGAAGGGATGVAN